MSKKIILSKEELQLIRKLFLAGTSKLKIARDMNYGKAVINTAFLEWDIPNNLNSGDEIICIIRYYIYIIHNLINNKIYVGQTKDFEDRWRRHKRGAAGDESYYLYNSMRKHGIENFTYNEVENFGNLDDCNYAEEFWIEFLHSCDRKIGYNMRKGGNNHELSQEIRDKISAAHMGKKASAETRKKMSDAHSGENNSMFGRKHTDESKQFMSELKVGKYDGENNPFYGKTHTEETRKLMSENNTGLYVGEKNPMYGKTHTPEVRKFLSEINKSENQHKKKGKSWNIIEDYTGLLEKDSKDKM
jgi:group I intron endonuclease